jgi:hypothetical protein
MCIKTTPPKVFQRCFMRPACLMVHRLAASSNETFFMDTRHLPHCVSWIAFPCTVLLIHTKHFPLRPRCRTLLSQARLASEATSGAFVPPPGSTTIYTPHIGSEYPTHHVPQCTFRMRDEHNTFYCATNPYLSLC